MFKDVFEKGIGSFLASVMKKYLVPHVIDEISKNKYLTEKEITCLVNEIKLSISKYEKEGEIYRKEISEFFYKIMKELKNNSFQSHKDN